MRPGHRRIPDGCEPPAALRNLYALGAERAGEAWGPPPPPTPWANR